MNVRAIVHLMSFVVMVVGAAMSGCALVGRLHGDPASAVHALALSGGLWVAISLMAWSFSRGRVDLTRRDGFVIVALSWVIVGIVGAFPYVLSGVIPRPLDALFESVSGFTTTGASVLSHLETIPRGILFWRALTHFFGGMGVLVLCVAILPILGTGGMQLFRAEMPGPSKDRLTPRIATTAKLLWGVYVMLCVLEALLLRLGGMSWFDAWCHSFATVATGGFSTRSDSIAAFQSPLIETLIMIFMFLAGTNFALHYRFLLGSFGVYRKDPEFRLYLTVWLCAGLWICAHRLALDSAAAAVTIRESLFQVTSIMTCTGFSTADFDRWPLATRLVLILLMIIGGCAGSTAGGLKQIRVYMVFKYVFREIQLALLPQAVVRLKVGREAVDSAVADHVVGFTLLFSLVFIIASLAMACFVPDLDTAISSVASTLSNVGPGLGLVGPAQTYAPLPAAAKTILIGCMLMGRLEFLTILTLLLPRFWRR